MCPMRRWLFGRQPVAESYLIAQLNAHPVSNGVVFHRTASTDFGAL